MSDVRLNNSYVDASNTTSPPTKLWPHRSSIVMTYDVMLVVGGLSSRPGTFGGSYDVLAPYGGGGTVGTAKYLF